ncbi:MAG: zinc-binding dehydrogenase [Actinobacteria bacterium]|jgi:NADPH:quinone reductase-like Zn-dependent oxidoreductase|nr:zinc-binding dehydrogenase [Actinomycetota bacterium]
MRAAYAKRIDALYPLRGLEVGDIAEAPVPDSWVTVNVRAASINHHDLWSLRGAGLTEDRLPMILGTDAAGVTDDGREVIVHAVLGDPDRGYGDDTKDPQRQILSEWVPGTFAERVRVPARNLVDKPAGLSWESAACLPTAWLTAYRMLTTHGHGVPGETVLVQGAGGGVSTAAILLGKMMGLRVWVTSREEAKRVWARDIGADAAFAPGETVPDPVDLVIETVGAATWQHSVDSVRFGGRIVVSGITSGAMPGADLLSILAKVITVQGSVCGTTAELKELANALVHSGVTPIIDRVLPLERIHEGLEAMEKGQLRGKVVLHV